MENCEKLLGDIVVAEGVLHGKVELMPANVPERMDEDCHTILLLMSRLFSIRRSNPLPSVRVHSLPTGAKHRDWYVLLKLLYVPDLTGCLYILINISPRILHTHSSRWEFVEQ